MINFQYPSYVIAFPNFLHIEDKWWWGNQSFVKWRVDKTASFCGENGHLELCSDVSETIVQYP